jgi:hypothetical protein
MGKSATPPSDQKKLSVTYLSHRHFLPIGGRNFFPISKVHLMNIKGFADCPWSYTQQNHFTEVA